MSEQNWCFVSAIDGAETRQVKVNNEIAGLLSQYASVLEIIWGYPWIFTQLICPECRTHSCRHGRQRRLRRVVLHEFVWTCFCRAHPKRNEDGERLDIHHRNEDKLDARIKNLQLLARSQHARTHVRQRRKVTYRQRHNFGGFRFRPHQPAKVKTPADDEKLRAMVGLKSATAAKRRPTTTQERLRGLEEVLAGQYPMVAGAMRPTGPQEPIPRSASPKEWRSRKTTGLGLREFRMACTAGEACFVLLYILHDLDLDRVAEDLDEPVDLVRLFLKRVPVSVAIDRWVKYRRIPEVISDRRRPSPIARATGSRRGAGGQGEGGR